MFDTKATIFLFLGLRISWPEKRVGRSEKKKKKVWIITCQVVEESYMEIEIKIGVFKGNNIILVYAVVTQNYPQDI